MKFLLILAALSFPAASAIIPPVYNGLPDSTDEAFTLTDIDGGADDTGTSLISFSGSSNTFDHEFGVYQFVDGAVFDSVAVLTDSDFGATSNVLWDLDNMTATTKYGQMGLSDQSIEFGFYFVSDSSIFYSHKELNAGESDFFGLYWDADPFTDADLFVYATDGGSSCCLDTMTVSVNDVSPIVRGADVEVSEGGTIALLALGLVCLASTKRRRI